MTMTNEEMLEQCGAVLDYRGYYASFPTKQSLDALIEQAKAEEREECAKIAEDTPTALLPNGQFLSERVAKAIRARKP